MVDRSGGLSGFSFGGMVPGGKEDLLFFDFGLIQGNSSGTGRGLV